MNKLVPQEGPSLTDNSTLKFLKETLDVKYDEPLQRQPIVPRQNIVVLHFCFFKFVNNI